MKNGFSPNWGYVPRGWTPRREGFENEREDAVEARRRKDATEWKQYESMAMFNKC